MDFRGAEMQAAEAADRLADVKAQRDRLNAWAERATKALCKVRPLGGSELFVRVNGQSLADPEYCGAAIEKMHADLHEARCEIARLRKSKSE